MNGTARGWPAYKVTDAVTVHEAWAIGVYAFFNRAPVVVDNAIEVPRNVPGIKMRNMVTISLGNNQGEITNVINGTGGAVNPASFRRTVTNYP
jgi:hypothetical protein